MASAGTLISSSLGFLPFFGLNRLEIFAKGGGRDHPGGQNDQIHVLEEDLLPHQFVIGLNWRACCPWRALRGT